jgi:hypothetical protein
MFWLNHNFLLFDSNGCSQPGGFGSFQGVHKIFNPQKKNIFWSCILLVISEHVKGYNYKLGCGGCNLNLRVPQGCYILIWELFMIVIAHCLTGQIQDKTTFIF